MTANQKKIAIAAICLAVLAGGAAGVYYKFYASPDPSKMSGEQIRTYMTSPDFNSMAREQRHEFFEKVMDSRVNGYFQAPPEDRSKYLDKILDEMKDMRPRSTDQANQQRRRMDPNMINRMRNSNPEQRRLRNESRDPVQSQKRREFFMALASRAKQRGMQMPGGRGFGGGPRPGM